MHKEFIKTVKLNQKLVVKKGKPEKEDYDQNSQAPRCLQITWWSSNHVNTRFTAYSEWQTLLSEIGYLSHHSALMRLSTCLYGFKISRSSSIFVSGLIAFLMLVCSSSSVNIFGCGFSCHLWSVSFGLCFLFIDSKSSVDMVTGPSCNLQASRSLWVLVILFSYFLRLPSFQLQVSGSILRF